MIKKMSSHDLKPMKRPNILFLCGSLRRDSTNRGLLRAAATFLKPEQADIVWGSCDLPLYNADIAPVPEQVETLCKQIQEADAVLIGCPEYNWGMTGALKNALDWISMRPGAFASRGGLPVASLSAGGPVGALNASTQLKEFVVKSKAQYVETPNPVNIKLWDGPPKFDAHGNLTDDSFLPAIQSVVHLLLEKAQARP